MKGTLEEVKAKVVEAIKKEISAAGKV